MSNKVIKELKNLTANELAAKERELGASLFQARMKKVTGQLEDTAQLWRLRKTLARVKMLISQGAAQAGQTTAKAAAPASAKKAAPKKAAAKKGSKAAEKSVTR